MLKIWWKTIKFEHIVVSQYPWFQVYNIICVVDIWFVQLKRDTLFTLHCVSGTLAEPTCMILCLLSLFWFQCRADSSLIGTVFIYDCIPPCQDPQRYVGLVVGFPFLSLFLGMKISKRIVVLFNQMEKGPRGVISAPGYCQKTIKPTKQHLLLLLCFLWSKIGKICHLYHDLRVWQFLVFILWVVAWITVYSSKYRPMWQLFDWFNRSMQPIVFYGSMQAINFLHWGQSKWANIHIL